MDEGDRLAEIVGDWLDRRRRGEYVDPEDVIQAYPELEDSLRMRFATMAALDEIIEEASAQQTGTPSEIGGFRVLRELGSGGMGTVYLARTGPDVSGLASGETVALKVIHPHLLAKPGFFRRFLREAELGRRVRHRNVVRALHADASLVDGTQVNFLVMEYVEGKTLRDLLRELGTVPEALLREIAQQVSAGLAAIHAAGIVHRDLKPENILITDDHKVRIMDLGVARITDESMILTQDGQFAGSLHYAAPEQFRKGEVGLGADLYSLGVLLYELATGDNPFRLDEAAAVMNAHLNSVPPRANERNSGISPFLSEVLAALLSKEPDGRIGSADSLTEVLGAGEESSWWADRECSLALALRRIPRIPVRRETKLHGREEDLVLLGEAWAEARQGRGCTVLVEGEAGIGKSRFLDAFVAGFSGEEAYVLYGSHAPSGGRGGLSDALIGHFGAVRLAESLAPHLGRIPSLIPAFSAWVKHEAPPPGEASLGGDALHAVFAQLLQGLSAERPTVWIVEDLHFADADTRKIVEALARGVEDHPVLLLLTTRPGLPAADVAHLSQGAGFRRMPLGRLSARQVILLLQDAFRSEALADKLGARIALKSDGVPFFVFEMIQGLKEGQFISELPDGTYVETREIERIDVPSAVRDLIAARLADLDMDQRALLDVGAAQGFEFDATLVARALKKERIQVLQSLAEVERRSGIVRAEGRLYRFDHHQIHEVLYESIPEALRLEYHTALAQAFAEQDGVSGRGPDDLTADASCFLATHHIRGVRPRECLPYLLPSIIHLEKAYRNDAALQLADRALGEDGLLVGSGRADVLCRKAQLESHKGNQEGELTALEQALELADEDSESGSKGSILLELGNHYDLKWQLEEAQKWLALALDLARRTGDLALEGRAQGHIGFVFQRLGRIVEARQHLDEAVSIARQRGDLNSQAGMTINRGIISQVAGEYNEAREFYERGIKLAREAGNLRFEANGTGNLGNVLGLMGRREEALDQLETARSIAKATGSIRPQQRFTLGLGMYRRELGRTAEAQEYIEKALALARQMGDRRGEGTVRQELGSQLASLGRIADARHCFEEALRIHREIGARRHECSALADLGELAHLEGDDREALRLLRDAQALREVAFPGVAASIQLGLGRIEAARGNLDEARKHFEKGRLDAAEIGASTTTVLCACHLALFPEGDSACALEMFVEHRERLGHPAEMEARFLLWRVTTDLEHIEEAHRLLTHALDHAPAENRESMIENVPLHRKIMTAWKGRRGRA